MMSRGGTDEKVTIHRDADRFDSEGGRGWPGSRPRVSDDNAYAEALFRTAKYRPEFPAKGFASLDEARGGQVCGRVTVGL